MKMAFSSFPLPTLRSPLPIIQSTLFKVGAAVALVLLCIGLLLAPAPLPSFLQEIQAFHLSGSGLPTAYHQAMRFRQQGDLLAALSALEKATIASPQSVPVLYELGRTEFQLGQVAPAIDHYRQALDLEPDHAASAYELGGILVTLGQLNEGIHWLQHSAAIAPMPVTYYDLGIALGRSGDRQGEIQQLQQAITLQPDYADAHLNLGIAYARLNNLPPAQQHLQKARDYYQAEIEKLEHAHLGRNSLDARILDHMIAALDSGCGVQCWQQE
jgi:tetratricopeptide (TPR) repeat protein